MLVLAHRGLHGGVPENTMAAFQAAVAAGADGIETDVRLSKDGVPILYHDPSFRRRRVRAMTRAELSRTVGFEVPSLDKALERFDVFWNVEIKSKDAVGPTIEVLRRYATSRRLLVTSFRPDIVSRVSGALELECGRILGRGRVKGRRNAGAAWVWQYRIANLRLVRREHRRGYRIFVYGPRTRAEHDRLRGLGVDGVITDWPELLRLSGA